MQSANTTSSQAAKVSEVLKNFVRWLGSYGEVSWDHQSFFAGTFGNWAKSLYYKNKLLGLVPVAPMIFCEALMPRARRFFHHPIRLPIADAHYAMGFAFLLPKSLTDRPRLRADMTSFSRCSKAVQCTGSATAPPEPTICLGPCAVSTKVNLEVSISDSTCRTAASNGARSMGP